MRKFGLRLPSPAMVVAILALFVALGGTGYAASQLTDRSRAVVATNKKRADGAQDVAQLKSFFRANKASLVGPRGPQGLQGPGGAMGPKGDTGATGPRGPSDVYYGHNSSGIDLHGNIAGFKAGLIGEITNIPAGTYAITGKTTIADAASADYVGFCYLVDETRSVTIDSTGWAVQGNFAGAWREPVTLTGAYVSPATWTLGLECSDPAGAPGNAEARDRSVIAIASTNLAANVTF